jgi:hypothetical protein
MSAASALEKEKKVLANNSVRSQQCAIPSGGRRGRRGEPMGDAVIPADPVEQHLPAQQVGIRIDAQTLSFYDAGSRQPA